MAGLDDFPSENPVEPIQCAAETAFEAAVKRVGHLFAVQQSDRCDYGTDYQLELKSHCHRTNYRLHVQLKGTSKQTEEDGAIKIRVDRTNLNYLLTQPSSMYVVFSLATEQLWYRFAEDAYVDLLKRNRVDGTSIDQDTLTVRFEQSLDDSEFERIHPILLANRKAERDTRIRWKVEAPTSARTIIRDSAHQIQVPVDRDEAKRLLAQLREDGEDATISSAFDRFLAVLDGDWGAVAGLYFAEVDLASNNHPFDQDRVAQAILFLEKSKGRRGVHPGSISYSLGNAYSALGHHTIPLPRCHYELG